MDEIRQSKARILGVVFNKADIRNKNNYYKYYYRQYYYADGEKPDSH